MKFYCKRGGKNGGDEGQAAERFRCPAFHVEAVPRAVPMKLLIHRRRLLL